VTPNRMSVYHLVADAIAGALAKEHPWGSLVAAHTLRGSAGACSSTRPETSGSPQCGQGDSKRPASPYAFPPVVDLPVRAGRVRRFPRRRREGSPATGPVSRAREGGKMGSMAMCGKAQWLAVVTVGCQRCNRPAAAGSSGAAVVTSAAGRSVWGARVRSRQEAARLRGAPTGHP
jgi:hypothetical protein